MLSILIPVYNHDCSVLVNTLYEQCNREKIKFEIIIAEDGSSDVYTYQEENNIRHIIRTKNVGRSAIRNFLFNEAIYPNLLVMDCDVTITNHDFIKTYLLYSNTHKILCGNIIYKTQCKGKYNQLRCSYEKKYYDTHSVKKLNRMNRPPFRTTCFLIHKSITQTIRFDERFTKYGYEDVKFGKDLYDAGYKVFYINIPILVYSNETDQEFIKKTEQAIQTLCNFKDDLRKDCKLLQYAEYLQNHLFILRGINIICKFIPSKVIKFQIWKLNTCINNL